jgi:hypothetical protein
MEVVMPNRPDRPEIDHRTMKAIVGAIALGLPLAVDALAQGLDSISEAYHRGGPALVWFAGCLFAIAAFLASYNGKDRLESWLSRVAAVAALGVALFPCQCARPLVALPGVHAVSAVVMFGVLSAMCVIFFRRASTKGYPQAAIRKLIYAGCLVVILGAMAAVAIDKLFDLDIARLTFYAEWAALWAFGVSWLTASRIVPGLAHREERIHPWGDSPPDDAGSATPARGPLVQSA